MTTTTARSRATASDPLAPDVVELVLVGPAGNSTSLSQRIRSLFAMDTRFTDTHSAQVLDRNAVLHPDQPGTLYLWITFGSGKYARVYVAMREQEGQSARYLFREVELKSGLDEVGSETVAQVAHSSARALWAREWQSSGNAVASAMETDPIAEHSTHSENSVELPIVPKADSAPRTEPLLALPRAESQLEAHKPHAYQLVFAALYSGQASGGEGWLQELGATLKVTWREHYTARVSGAFLLPHQFDAPLTTVQLTAMTGQVAFGWKTTLVGGLRGHIETGLGVMSLQWHADANVPARALPGASQFRPFAAESIGGEWLLGFVSLAARFELRVPFRDTTYEVGNGSNSASVHAWLSEGFALELGIPLDRLF